MTLSPQDQHILTHTQSIRLSGKFHAAVQHLNPIVARHLQNPEVVLEALRLVILVQDHVQIKQLFDLAMSTPTVAPYMTSELYLRALSEMKQPLPTTLPPFAGDNNDWVTKQLAGEDSTVDFQIQDLSLNCSTGPTHFYFDVSCSCCQHTFQINLYASLFVQKETRCPKCLGLGSFDFDEIKNYLSHHKQIMTGDEIEKYESALIDLQHRVGAYNNEDVPLICRSMNQNFIFYFNNLVSKRLLANS